MFLAYLVSRRSIGALHASFPPHMAADACSLFSFKYLFCNVTPECRCLVCTTIKRGDTPQKCSRRKRCPRASSPFWRLAWLFSLPLVHSSSPASQSMLSRSCLSRYPTNTKVFNSGRVHSAPNILPMATGDISVANKRILATLTNNPLKVRNPMLAASLSKSYSFHGIMPIFRRIKCRLRSKVLVRAHQLHSFLRAVRSSKINHHGSRAPRSITSWATLSVVKVARYTIQ